MHLKYKSKLKTRIVSVLRHFTERMENKANADFNTNGEKHFIKDLAAYYAGADICVFDVGANMGNYFAMVAHELDAQHVSYAGHLFEPMASCFRELENKFRSKSNITLNGFGVSNHKDESLLYYDKEKSGLASLYQRNLKAYRIAMDKSETIRLERLDTYIEAQHIRKIHFLKMDIEGHELSGFKGMGKYLNPDFIDFIQFEYGGCNIDSNTTLFDLYEMLEKTGFAVGRIMPKHIEIRKYDKSMDDFVYANYVALNKNILDRTGHA